MSNNNELTIKCPDCGAIIPLSDSAYNNIVSQVCNEEVDRRVATMKNEMQARLKEKVSDIEARIEQKYLAELQEKRTHFVQLKAQKEKEDQSCRMRSQEQRQKNHSLLQVRYLSETSAFQNSRLRT